MTTKETLLKFENNLKVGSMHIHEKTNYEPRVLFVEDVY